jgi:uncharacterized membrane protein YdjX (TVP38/TMEM64 family)
MARSIVSRTIKIALAVAAAVAVVTAIVWLPVGGWIQDAVAWIRGQGVIGVVVFSLVFVGVCLTPLPSVELYVGAGLLYGVWWGALLTNSLGLVVELCTLWLVHTRLRERIERRIEAHPRVAAVDRAISEHSFWIVQLLRLSPLIPFGLLNYALAMTKMPLWKRLLTNFLGMAPMSLAQAYLGSLLYGVGALEDGPPATWKYIALAVGVATVVAATVITGWATRRVLGREQDA